MASSAIHKICASNWSAASTGSSAAHITAPRETSISSAKVSVTDCPVCATGKSPFAVTMRSSVLSRPPGRIRTLSPALICPLATWPEKPRNAISGRVTHCTGRVKPAAFAGVSAATVSRNGISAGPSYQPVMALSATILSPFNAETGMAVTEAKSSRSAKPAKSSQIS